MAARLNRLKRHRVRRGIETLELILALPVLVLATVGVLQYGLMMVVNHAVVTAAHEAAREAEKGADINEAGSVVDTFLAIHNLTVGPGVRVVYHHDTGLIESVGDATLTSTRLTVPPPAGELRVLVLVALSQAPLPNALASYGIDFSGNQYEGSSIVVQR